MNLKSFNKLCLASAISLAFAGPSIATEDAPRFAGKFDEDSERMSTNSSEISNTNQLNEHNTSIAKLLAVINNFEDISFEQLLAFMEEAEHISFDQLLAILNETEYTSFVQFLERIYEIENDEAEDDEGDANEEDDNGDGDGEEENDDENDQDEGSDEQSGDNSHSDHSSDNGHTNHCMMTPDFVDPSLITHTATQSGQWSDAATWGGKKPGDGAIIKIPQNIEVTINTELSSRLETVRIDGALIFSNDNNTRLQVDTLFSSCSGLLQIGTADKPISQDVKAKVIFIDDGAIGDSKLLSRGAILMGKTTIHGAAKTHRAVITPQAKQGDIELNLNLSPLGWQTNDELVITGTLPGDPLSDEIRSISQISGNRISLNKPLDLDHRAPKTDLNVYVANISRNVEFTSENLDVSRRGHIMFMHTLNVEVQNAKFTELGRTDKTRPLDDFQFNFHDGGDGDDAPDMADVIPLGGSNIRGRYPIHFHRGGTDINTTPALVKGSVVFNGPGWGFVSHSSHVDLIDNVSYGLQGAGFYTEAGDEIGSMQGSIAIRSVNRSFKIDDQGAIDPDLRANFMDYGHDGDGFWLTGNRVSMINNVAAGASAHGIIYWTDGIMEPDSSVATRVSIPTSNIPNGNLIANRTSIPVWWAPFAESRGNESYGATVGFRIRYVHAKNYLGRDEQSKFHRTPSQAYLDTLTPSVKDITVWGSRDGVLLNYNERLGLDGARIVGFGKDVSKFELNPGTAKEGIGLDFSNDATHGTARISNVTIEGFGMGFATPVNGDWEVQNIELQNNKTDLLTLPAESSPTQVKFKNVRYSSVLSMSEGEDEEELETSNKLAPHIIIVD